MTVPRGAPSSYGLTVGESGAARLNLLHRVYGPFCAEVLTSVGLQAGSRIADIGCGTGTLTAWLADQVGASGRVVAVDGSGEQLEIAKRQTAPRTNIEFVQASAYDTRLPRASFDLVHCRLLLLHLTDPLAALRGMVALVRPSGTVICFDIDVTTVQSLPQTEAYTRYVITSMRLGGALGVDFRIGSRLHRLFQDAGLEHPEIQFHYPVYLRGEEKRLFEYTSLEAAPKRIELGISTPEEVAEMRSLFAAVAADETIAIAQARMTACWAVIND